MPKFRLATALLTASFFATTANASTYQINAHYDSSSSIVGSFTMENNDPSTIANVNIDAIMPLGGPPSLPFPATVEITFDGVFDATDTWSLGYLWFINSQYYAGSNYFLMGFSRGFQLQISTTYSIGMWGNLANPHPSEISFPSLTTAGPWQYIVGEMTVIPDSVSSAVPEPSTWAMMLIGFAGLGFAFRQSRRKVSLA
jgi:hypothetical protein